MGIINVHNKFYKRQTIVMMVYYSGYIMYKAFESPVE